MFIFLTVKESTEGIGMEKGRRLARNSVGYYALISDKFLTSPALMSLPTMNDIGLYFLMLGKSDVFGCLQVYDSLAPTRISILGVLDQALPPMSFGESLRNLINAGLVLSLSWKLKTVFLLPHKLPTHALTYYPVPRHLPIRVIVSHILLKSQQDPYLSEICGQFNWTRLLDMFEDTTPEGTMADDFLPPWINKEIVKKVKPPKLPEREPEMFPVTSKLSDPRIVVLQQQIRDNGYDIVMSEEQLLSLVIRFGTEYTKLMIDEYGDWRLNNKKTASSHSSHIRAIQKPWVHEHVTAKRLINPNDEFIELEWNVIVPKDDVEKIKKYIKDKLKVSDEDVEEYLRTIANDVSIFKAKNKATGIETDGNRILDKIDRYAEYKAMTNGR